MSPTAETITHQYPHPPTRIGSAKPGGRRPSTGGRRLSRNDSVKVHFRMKYNMSSDHVQNSSSTDIDHKLKLEFFQKEPCKYSHEVFLKAAKIYSALKHDSKDEKENPYLQRKNRDALAAKVQDIPHLTFTDDQEKRLVFELAFTALKYQMLFEDVLQDCSFFAQFPEFNEDSGLVMVMLCDFQSRKFQHRTPFPDEKLDETAEQIEEALLQVKTRLNAALARHRIKAAAPSLDHLLPDAVRSKEELRSNMPMYVWVNQIKTTISEVIEQFKDDGYKLVDSGEKLEERHFSVDNLCNDVLIFPPESKEDLLECELLQSGKIVLQDKSSCLAPHSVKYLLGEGDDIIHVNAGSGATTAHIASLLKDNNNHIWTFGSQSTTDVQKIQKTMERLGIKGVKNLQDSFLDIEPDDTRFKNVKVILVTADCSKSGIANPIDFIVNEGEDAKILKDLSVGETDLTKLGELVGQHGNLLKHAMKFSKVQAVVYMTRSIHEAENENVVTKSVEYINMIQHRKFPYRVVPPVLQFSGEDIDNKRGLHGKYIKFFPAERTSGCFVAVITREPEDPKEAAKDVLARAQAKGLLGHRKSKSPKETVSLEHQVNGEVSDTVLVNGHAESDAKLLNKRTRKAPRKIPMRSAVSAQHSTSTPAYNKPHASSPIHNYIHSPTPKPSRAKQPNTAKSSFARLYQSRTKSLDDHFQHDDKPRHVSEHLKVVKHPAPFRRQRKSKTKQKS